MKLHYLIRLLFSVFLFSYSLCLFSQRIFINEFVAKNGNINSDFEQEYPDWIELYNAEDTAVNLTGFYLTDNELERERGLLPNIAIEPKGFLLFFASDKNTISSSGEIHLGFKISSIGEELFLYDSFENLIDKTGEISLLRNQSYARIPDGADFFFISDLPTPNASNFRSNVITSSHSSGFYSDFFELKLTPEISGDSIFYTINGSDPMLQDSFFNQSLIVNDRSSLPDIYSIIPTTPPDTFNRFYWYWKPPESPVSKATVLKYRSFRNGIPSSKIYSHTFFIGEEFQNRYKFPVVSVVTDSLSLFDHETGIYIPGATFDSVGWKNQPIGNYMNRGDEWERPAIVDFFNENKELQFSTGIGLRAHGHGSMGLPQKGLRLVFKDLRGMDQIDYPVFPEKPDLTNFKRLILRTGNGSIEVNFLDALLHDLVKDIGLDIQSYQPAIVFLNGEYWGIFNIREKRDGHYLSGNTGIPKDEILIRFPCGGVEFGSGREFDVLENFLENNSLESDSNFAIIDTLLDVSNFIDYSILNLFYANQDWTTNHRWWGTKGNKTKWRKLIYDLDIAFGFGWQDPQPELNLFPSFSDSSICHTFVFRKLLENQSFQEIFVSRTEEFLKTNFHSDTIINRFEYFRNQFQPHIKEHIDRWQYPESVEAWNQRIDEFQRYARVRPCYFKTQVEEFFGIDSLDFDCNDTLSLSSEINQLNFSLFPNPAGNQFFIKGDFSGFSKGTSLHVFNQLGHLAHSFERINQRPFDVSDLPSGIYFVVLKDQNRTLWREKLMIMN